MKPFAFIALAALLAVGCQRSLEDQAARELADYSARHCPLAYSESLRLDSCRFERVSRTLHYFYTISGNLDSDSMIAVYREQLQNDLRQAVINEPSTMSYKQAGFLFKYSYFSTVCPGTLLFESTFDEKDYGPSQRQKQ